MPDEQGNHGIDEDETPSTSLHAHAEGREEDVIGNPTPEVREDGDLDRGVGNPVGDEDDVPSADEGEEE